MATLLSICQNVADRIGLVRPSSVVGATDPQLRSLLSLANQEGRDLARRHAWQRLTKEKTFTTVATEAQTNALPDDFDRFVPETFYNRTKARPVEGPLTAQEYADYKGRLSTWAFEKFRLRGNDILILPTPAAGETMAYEYVSLWWAALASDTTTGVADEFENDSDEPLLDSEAVTLGVSWRFLRARGLDYSEPFAQYENAVAQLIGRDGGTRRLSMGPPQAFRPRPPSPPEGNWNI